MDAIIFDLGGVLLNLDFSATAQAFTQLGSSDFDALWQARFFERFETGHLSAADFRQQLRRALQLPQATDAQLDAAWNAMLGDLPAANLALLQALRRRYKLFLLSNSNEIHIEQINRVCLKPHGVPDLTSYFDAVYFSCRIGQRKPDAAAFQHVLAAQKLDPRTTAFIDDLALNIEAAKQLGLDARHLPPGTPLGSVLPAPL